MKKVELADKNKTDEKTTIVEIGLPKVITIEPTQSNELRHYEIFFASASLLFSTAVSFWTAYFITNLSQALLAWVAFAFSLSAVFFGIIAFYYRKKVFNGKIKKTIPLDEFK